MVEARYIALVLTAISVAGSIWAMKKRYGRKVVAGFMAGGLLGLLAFSLLSL